MFKLTHHRRTLAAASAAFGALACALAAGAQTKPSAISGVWYDDTGKGAVELKPCGAGICGHIYWLREPNDKNGQPLTDGYNPDTGLRARPICGLQVIGNLKSQGDGTFDGGWVYDPKVGKQYNVYIEPASRTTLTVTGYKGVKLLGKSFTWTRAPANLPRCGVREASAPRPSPPAPTGAQPRP
jgi:uncharacterized protein (DUF2147 family)